MPVVWGRGKGEGGRGKGGRGGCKGYPKFSNFSPTFAHFTKKIVMEKIVLLELLVHRNIFRTIHQCENTCAMAKPSE